MGITKQSVKVDEQLTLLGGSQVQLQPAPFFTTVFVYKIVPFEQTLYRSTSLRDW